MTIDEQPLLKMSGIHKTFPAVKALTNVDFRLFPGEVHALMGENGAGKSTLIKVLTGVYAIDAGSVELAGKPVWIGSPQEAQSAGISTVYQEVNLCPNLSVAENIYIGREPRKWGRILWKQMIRDAAELLKHRLRLTIDVTQPLKAYSVAIQQLIAIARAVSVSAKVLILDEPTSSLDRGEVLQLFAIMTRLKEEGLAILFVTHFLDQVYEIADRITILRGGERIGEYRTAELPRLELVARMIGKDIDELEELPRSSGGQAEQEDKEVLLALEGVGRKGSIDPVDLVIRQGEVVGLAGLLGSGRTELVRLLFAADRADSGVFKLRGIPVPLTTPKQAIAGGIAFCPENRKLEGIVDELTVRENIILALQASQGWFKPLPRKRQNEIADAYIRALDIKTPHGEQLIKNLSGGNQQKVLLARWLLIKPALLILDEPTRGIDIGAKTEIQRLVLSLAADGMSVIFISSELEEVLRISDRIVVLRDRHKVEELAGAAISQSQVMKAIAGG